MVIKHVPNKRNTIYHINRDHYDCHKFNLGISDKRRQNIKHPIQKNNRSGIVGVYYNRQKNIWYAMWVDEDGKSCKKSYSLKKHGFLVAEQQAIDQRSRVERELPHYADALRLNVDGHQ